MKIPATRVDGFVRRPDPAAVAILLYGPDGGLVRERAAALGATVVTDPQDPFRTVELTGDALKADPPRLADEAAALSLVGGRRLVRVRDAGDDLAGLFAAFLADPKGDALVVVEAGDLSKRSALRLTFEEAANAAALACYPDEGEGLADLAIRALAADRIGIDDDALAWLTAHLGNDRRVSRNELEKLALYVGAGGRARLADVQACIGDSAATSLDDVVTAVAGGDVAAVFRALDRAYAEGVATIAILRATARHFQRLHMASGLVAAGATPDRAMQQLRPPIFFKSRGAFAAQLKRWPLQWLAAAIDRLTRAEIDCKSTGLPDETICARTLTEIARAARRR